MQTTDSASITADWGFPTRVLVGPGRLSETPELCREYGFTRPLVVTDPGVAGLAFTNGLMEALNGAGIEASLFTDVEADPKAATVEAGVAAFTRGRHDAVIGLGGGSALDAAKAVALMAGQTRPIWDFEDRGDNWKRADANAIAPVIAIPTTAGTGSEVGRASVITDAQARRKVIVYHPRMLPVAAILDPEVTLGLPRHLTAATGMDAVTHCVEAWSAPGFHPMAEGIALAGVRQAMDALPRACRDGADVDARTRMLAVATMGTTALQKGLGAVHAIAHPVGTLCHTHHGLTNAVLLPYVLMFNRAALEPRIEPLAEAFGLPGQGPGHAFDAVVQRVLDLRTELGMPHTLAEIGVDASHAEEVGRLGEIDPTAGGNPIPVRARELSDIFLRAVEGRL